MLLEFEIDTERRLIIGKASGIIDHSSLIDIVKQMVNHPDYDSTYNEIWDIREVENIKTFFEQTDERVENEHAIRRIKEPNKESIVVANPVQYGLARQYATLAEKIPLRVEIFYDYDIALQWVTAR